MNIALKKPSIEELFYRDELKLVLQLTVDSRDHALQLPDIPFVIGALTFLARLDDATALFQRFNADFSVEQRIISRFFLGVGHCRHYKFQEGRGYLIANARDRRHATQPRALFYIYQGLGLYRYTYGHPSKAVTWSSKALQIAVASQYLYGRILAAELKAHAIINTGQLRAGLRIMEELQELARELGYEKVTQWSEINRVLYQSNYGLLGNRAVSELKRVLNALTVTDSFSRASILIEIARQQILAGEADQAKQTLDSACQDIYQVENLRLETLLNLRIAHYLYVRGERHQALNLIRNSLKRLASCEDKVLEQCARGFELKILEELGMHDEAEGLHRRLVRMTNASGLYIGKKILERKYNHFELENVRGQDPLGDAIDLVHLRAEDVVPEIIENGWLSLFYRLFLIPANEKVIYLDIERSGSLTLFDRGNVQHYSKQVPPLIRKLLLCLRQGEKTKEQLVEEIWRYSYQPQRHDNLVYALVANARKILESKGMWIEASEAGYQLMPGVVLRQRFDASRLSTSETLSHLDEAPFVNAIVASAAASDKPPGYLTRERYDLLNFRQRSALARIEQDAVLDSQTYRHWFEVSEATANRDLADLVDLAILTKVGKARATKYVLKSNS